MKAKQKVGRWIALGLVAGIVATWGGFGLAAGAPSSIKTCTAIKTGKIKVTTTGGCKAGKETLTTWDDHALVASQGSQLAAKNAQIAALNGQVTNLNAQILLKNAQITNLNGQVATLTGQVAGLTADVSTLNAVVADLRNQIAVLQSGDLFAAARQFCNVWFTDGDVTTAIRNNPTIMNSLDQMCALAR